MIHKIMSPEDRTRWVCQAFAIRLMKKEELEAAVDTWDEVDCPKCLQIKETVIGEE